MGTIASCHSQECQLCPSQLGSPGNGLIGSKPQVLSLGADTWVSEPCGDVPVIRHWGGRGRSWFSQPSLTMGFLVSEKELVSMNREKRN